MRNELTNLLPPERQRMLRRYYFIRLGVVATTLVILLILAAALLLLPTYVFLTESAKTEQDRIANTENTINSSDEATLSSRLIELSNSTVALSALANTHPVSALMNNVLVIPRPGIVLSGFDYGPGVGESAGTLAVSGTATTRDALRNYQLALEGASFARSADLPVSAYAKDTEISFTITVTLAP